MSYHTNDNGRAREKVSASWPIQSQDILTDDVVLFVHIPTPSVQLKLIYGVVEAINVLLPDVTK